MKSCMAERTSPWLCPSSTCPSSMLSQCPYHKQLDLCLGHLRLQKSVLVVTNNLLCEASHLIRRNVSWRCGWNKKIEGDHSRSTLVSVFQVHWTVFLWCLNCWYYVPPTHRAISNSKESKSKPNTRNSWSAAFAISLVRTCPNKHANWWSWLSKWCNSTFSTWCVLIYMRS